MLAVERPDLRVLVVDPGDMRTEMHQDAFPGEDISDRPEPAESVPGLVALIEGDAPSGRYEARASAPGIEAAMTRLRPAASTSCSTPPTKPTNLLRRAAGGVTTYVCW